MKNVGLLRFSDARVDNVNGGDLHRNLLSGYADGVNMVGVILRIVIFYQEKWTVETVIVRLTTVLQTGPGKVDRFQTGVIQLPIQ